MIEKYVNYAEPKTKKFGMFSCYTQFIHKNIRAHAISYRVYTDIQHCAASLLSELIKNVSFLPYTFYNPKEADNFIHLGSRISKEDV